jgi:predicted phosphodiesterase
VTIWAFLSDIHGNWPALQRAEALARESGATKFVCLGDVIGRGAPDACVQWVRDHAHIAIVGNRDLDYLNRIQPDLQDVVRGWVSEARDSDFIVSHGDPKLHASLNSRAERDDFRQVAAYLSQRGARLWLFGHTHRARVWQIDSQSSPILQAATVLEIGDTCPFVVNVGTTGLPLPGRGPASFTIYDDVRRTLRMQELPAARKRPLERGTTPRVDRPLQRVTGRNNE